MQTREDAVEHLLVYLSGTGDLAEGEKQDLDKGVDDESMGGDDATTTWDAVKLPKAFQEEQLNVLWQGCFYCKCRLTLSLQKQGSDHHYLKTMQTECFAHIRCGNQACTCATNHSPSRSLLLN